jgi:hypothetical protein
MAVTPEELISRFDPITLQEMDGVKLQDRVDTKYVIGQHQLPEILAAMLKDYRLLTVDGVRGTSYRSLYYDTVDLKHYHDHHNKRTFRSKIRFREYIGSGLAYLEVKKKTGRGRTDKKRLQVSSIPDKLQPEHEAFITKHLHQDQLLAATIWNHFTRYTFVNRNNPERLTLDVGLTFTDAATKRELGDVVVAELKQEKADRMSPFVAIMRSMGIRPSGMSKYCIGMLMVGRPVKHNQFKQVLMKLRRLRNAA